MLPLAVLLCTTVAGPVLAASLRKEASWYGKFHHGRLMANGRPFRMTQATVAHRTLPLGIVVEMRNLERHQRALVRVGLRHPAGLLPAAAHCPKTKDNACKRIVFIDEVVQHGSRSV